MQRKYSFAASGAPVPLLSVNDTAAGLGPSTSGVSQQWPASPVDQSWSGGTGPDANTWVWALAIGLSETESALAGGEVAAAAAPWFSWKRGSDGCGGGRGLGDGGKDGRLQRRRWPWWLRDQHHHQPHAQSHGGGVNGDGGGHSGGSRLLLLASLTTSAVATASRASGASGRGEGAEGTAASGGGGGAGAGPPHGFHLPQLSIMRLPGSPSFAEEQDLAQELLDYHKFKHGGLPRPCPRCKSHDFMVRSPESAKASPAAAVTSSSSAAGASTTTSAGNAPSGAGNGVVEWRSRPLRCETCGCWVHLGCAGVELAEQVPPRPWFHCRACRDTYLRLEAAAERNPHPSSASGTHALYLLTPADHLAARLQGGSANGAAAAAAVVTPFGGRGPAGAVVPLLLQGFNVHAVAGFAQPAREYDGGKYSAVLLSRGQPVAAATFNVFGADAQLCLLATAVQHRLKGNGSALVADLETTLAALGVRRMLVQARGVALPLWLGRLGYELVRPEEAAQLHTCLPIAYYDCAMLQKNLQPQQPQQQKQLEGRQRAASQMEADKETGKQAAVMTAAEQR